MAFLLPFSIYSLPINMIELFCMGNDIKQIYAALQIEEDEIKVLVAEYFNTRFNILRVEKAKTKAISDFRIANQLELENDIKALISRASTKLGTKIEKVILVLPAYNFKRFPLTSSVNISNGYVHKEDVARAVSNSLKTKVDADSMITNPVILKYTVNGISTRRLPEKEVCDSMLVDIDLLCCDAQMAYEYVMTVEKIGLQVLDICLNNYAICEEASLLSESSKKNVILLDIHNGLTYLTLLSKGKIITTEIVYDGLNTLTSKIYEKYHFNDDVMMRLIKYDVDYADKDECVVYAYNNNDKSETITNVELSSLVAEPLNNYVEKLISMCKPIIDSGETSIVVTGQGQSMKALMDKLKDLSGVEVRGYYPDTIGIRDANLVALYGSFVVYKNKADLNNLSVNCIDLLEYDNVINKHVFDKDGATITTKIKNFFMQYMSKEEE